MCSAGRGKPDGPLSIHNPACVPQAPKQPAQLPLSYFLMRLHFPMHTKDQKLPQASKQMVKGQCGRVVHVAPWCSEWQGASPLVCPQWVAGQRAGGGPSAHPGSAGIAHTGGAGWGAAGSVDGTPPARPARMGLRFRHDGVGTGWWGSGWEQQQGVW